MGNSYGSSGPAPSVPDSSSFAAQTIPQIEAHNKQPTMIPTGDRSTHVMPTNRVYRSELFTQNKRIQDENRLNRYASGNPKSGWRSMTAAATSSNTPSIGDAQAAFQKQTAASKAIIESLSATSAAKYAKSLQTKSKAIRFSKYDPLDGTRTHPEIAKQGPIPNTIRGLDPGKLDAIRGEKERLSMGFGQVYTGGNAK